MGVLWKFPGYVTKILITNCSFLIIYIFLYYKDYIRKLTYVIEYFKEKKINKRVVKQINFLLLKFKFYFLNVKLIKYIIK